MKYLLIAAALFGVFCLAWLEIELMLEFSQKGRMRVAYGFCIAAVGAIRFVLFLSSSFLYEKRAAFGWITGFMSLTATIALYVYAENLTGLDENTRLIYHLLNSLIAGSEVASAMAISSVNKMKTIEEEKKTSEKKRMILKKEINDIGISFETQEELREQLQQIAQYAEDWATIKNKIGVVQKKGSRYMIVDQYLTIHSTEADGTLTGSQPSIPTTKEAKLNGQLASIN